MENICGTNFVVLGILALVFIVFIVMVTLYIISIIESFIRFLKKDNKLEILKYGLKEALGFIVGLFVLLSILLGAGYLISYGLGWLISIFLCGK